MCPGTSPPQHNGRGRILTAREVIEEAVRAWEDGDEKAFWRLLAEDVEYSVIGTTEASGTYKSRQAFFEGALFPMSALMSESPIPAEIDIIAEGARVVLMWTGKGGVMKNGVPYENKYCWVLDVEDGRIVRVKAYLDTELVTALFNQ